MSVRGDEHSLQSTPRVGGGAREALSSGGSRGAIGALYFINGKGDILIQRTYRDDIE
jgi:hypothetical protein